MTIMKKLRARPGRKVNLKSTPTGDTPGCSSREAAEEALPALLEELRKLQYRLFAENRRAVLVVLQAMDAAGKDGLVRHVFSGLNPQGCRVTPFKAPSADEQEHDFLWRIHKQVPPRGEIGVFNRSHYEDVLIVRVHGLVEKAVWKARYEQIRVFEKLLGENGVTVLKFFLHISPQEQKERLLARLDNPERNWKFSEGDLNERKYWDDYQEAYEEAIGRCSTPEAPWHIIPSDRKWYRNWAVASILLQTMRDMKLKFPEPLADVKSLRRRLRRLP
ncbi:MAG: polyphosphate kinase 2 family protein [Kiritimatiellia bacterium]